MPRLDGSKDAGNRGRKGGAGRVSTLGGKEPTTDDEEWCAAVQKQGNIDQARKVGGGVLGFLPGGNDCAVDIFD